MDAALLPLAAIPSPTQGVWHLGPIPIRAYALCIVLGIIAACVITEIRMRRRGAPPYLVLDIALWAVLFGILGARIYHVITTPASYFGESGNFLDAFKIWQGGLGVWGSVAGGALGAWIATRKAGIPLTFVADALAPGLPVAQAIGRLGNWFNNELYGKETDKPWGLTIYNWDSRQGKALTESGTDDAIVKGIYQPTFLYEMLWCLAAAVAVYLLDRRFKFGKGRAFALYGMLYCVGRFWIEALRIDDAEQILGMRLNNWTSIVVFIGAALYFFRVQGPREHIVVDEDGTVRVVTADGAPYPGTAQADATTAGATTADATTIVDDDDGGDPDAERVSPPGATDPPGSTATAPAGAATDTDTLTVTDTTTETDSDTGADPATGTATALEPDASTGGARPDENDEDAKATRPAPNA